MCVCVRRYDVCTVWVEVRCVHVCIRRYGVCMCVLEGMVCVHVCVRRYDVCTCVC